MRWRGACGIMLFVGSTACSAPGGAVRAPAHCDVSAGDSCLQASAGEGTTPAIELTKTEQVELERIRRLPQIDRPAVWYVHAQAKAQWGGLGQHAAAALRDEPPFQPSPAEAAWALAQPHHEADLETLLRLHRTNNAWVKEVAFTALAMVGHRLADEELQDVSSQRWKVAMEQLARNAGAATALAVAERVERKTTSRTCKRLAAVWKIVRNLGDWDARETLFEKSGTAVGDWNIEGDYALAELLDPRAALFLAHLLGEIPPEAGGYWSSTWERADCEHRQLSETSLLRLIATLLREAGEQHEMVVQNVRSAVLARQSHSRALIEVLAELGGEKAIGRLRGLAAPKEPMPPPTYSNDLWQAAGDALWALGRARDRGSFDTLLRTVKRTRATGTLPADLPLDELRSGAAAGLVEWGDPKARPVLLALARQHSYRTHHWSPCEALAWLSSPEERLALARDLLVPTLPGVQALADSGCLITAAATRDTPGLAKLLIESLSQAQDPMSAALLGFALARQRIEPADQRQLAEWLDDPNRGRAAQLVLIARGQPKLAEAAFARADKSPPSLQPSSQNFSIRYPWAFAVDTAYLEDLANGRLFDGVRNVVHLAERFPEERWVREVMRDALGSEFSLHSKELERLRLRKHLYSMARSAGSETAAQGPIDTLLVLGERGSLLSLLRHPGPAQRPARLAYRKIEDWVARETSEDPD